MRFTGRWKGPLFPNIAVYTIGLPTSSILILLYTEALSSFLNSRHLKPTWSSCVAFSPKTPGYRICRWHHNLPIRGLGKSTKARKWFRHILQEIQCHDQLAQILRNMAFSWNTSGVAPTSRFQMDQSRSEHRIYGFPNWVQHTTWDYDYTSYSLHSTKVNTLEFE